VRGSINKYIDFVGFIDGCLFKLYRGLIKPSTLRLDHLVTLRQSMIRRELGSLSLETQQKIARIIIDLL
jgi:hypothetical protein